MIPQGYLLWIETTTGDRYLVVGWRDYTWGLRPVVVPLNEPVQRAATLPDGVDWKVRF